jgi:uncharacterized protein YndB with AHSA1/START domain
LGRIEKSVEIKASPERIWEMLAFDRHPEWFEERLSAEYTSKVRTAKDKFRVGASACIVEKHFGKFDVEVTESVENEKIACVCRGVPHSTDVVEMFSLEPTEAGTRITFVSDGEVTGLFYRVLERLFVRRAIEKGTEWSLEKLKSLLEK